MKTYKRFTLILGKIEKRRKFVISAFLLSAGLLLIQLTNLSGRYEAIFFLSVLTYFLSAWSLIEGLNGVEWLTVLVLPFLFTGGVGLFYFLVPSRWLTRVPVVILYGAGIYALLLIENIFSVAAIRTIQLLRSAQAVGFLMTLVTAFFIYNTILSFRAGPWFNLILIFITSLPLILQGLWCINLEKKLTSELWSFTLVLALVQAEIGLAISFWPVSVAVGSLASATVLYLSLGLAQHHLSQRLFSKTVNEYLSVGIVVFLVIFFTTHWGG